MNSTRRQIDRLAFVACLCGWGWFLLNLGGQTNKLPFPVCPIKLLFGVPCPACGSTHSVIQVFEGHFSEAFRYNPLGFVLAAGLVIVPIWVVVDHVRRRGSFRSFYNWFEHTLSRKQVALPAILLVVANWVWNILK